MGGGGFPDVTEFDIGQGHHFLCVGLLFTGLAIAASEGCGGFEFFGGFFVGIDGLDATCGVGFFGGSERFEGIGELGDEASDGLLMLGEVLIDLIVDGRVLEVGDSGFEVLDVLDELVDAKLLIGESLLDDGELGLCEIALGFVVDASLDGLGGIALADA